MLDQPVPQTRPMSVGDWMLTILLTAIPLVGIIMLFVWAFGSDTRSTKSNWAKAMLIWALIFIVLYAIIFAVFGAAILSSAYDM